MRLVYFSAASRGPKLNGSTYKDYLAALTSQFLSMTLNCVRKREVK